MWHQCFGKGGLRDQIYHPVQYGSNKSIKHIKREKSSQKIKYLGADERTINLKKRLPELTTRYEQEPGGTPMKYHIKYEQKTIVYAKKAFKVPAPVNYGGVG